MFLYKNLFLQLPTYASLIYSLCWLVLRLNPKEHEEHNSISLTFLNNVSETSTYLYLNNIRFDNLGKQKNKDYPTLTKPTVI